MKEFDYYEVVGVIAPGALLLVALVALYAPTRYQEIISLTNVSVGGFGVGLLMSYVIGQLLQTLGNLIEKSWWAAWDGNPSDWVRAGTRDVVSDSQRIKIWEIVQKMVSDEKPETMKRISRKTWHAVCRQIYARIAAAGRSNRVDKFNGVYGLCRGIAAGFLAIGIAMIFSPAFSRNLLILIIVMCAMALYRMHRFGVHYAREMFIQLIEESCRPSTS